MKTSQKAALSLIITVILFGFFYLLSYFGLINPDLPYYTEVGLFSQTTGIILLSFFLTVYLICFLMFNLKQDSVSIIHKRQEEVIYTVRKYEKPELVEELEELEELETVEESPQTGPAGTVQHLSGQVEIKIDNYDVPVPFSSKRDDDEVSNVEELSEEDESTPSYNKNFGKNSRLNSGLFLTGGQYFTITGNGKIEILDVISDEEDEVELAEEIEIPINVIEEREGVHYINKTLLNPAPEENRDFDRKFKTLVDSVLRPKLI